ncbi:DUF6293 family protein [Haloplanus litoreus]|uniref:HFX_2341 family transcriptional regulator domain-containing protein n=1 Tax=Haloplanus litoreus TaxID=767515 RepID=UPI00360DB615
MTERVHFIPVGFDFDRLIYPISKGQMEADRVVLITHEGDPDDDATDRAAELASNMTNRLEDSFELIDVEVEHEPIDIEELYEYETLYPMAHEYILDELEAGNEVFVNISSMPRTTAFAFATAADSIIAEYQSEVKGIRDMLHTYYVAPDKYLVLEMIDALEDAKDLFEKMSEDLRVHPQYTNIRDLLNKIDENGVTKGARDLDGQMYVEFPSSPGSDVEDFEETILNFLAEKDPIKSTSALAEQLAEEVGEEYDESFRSRVQYNVSKLDEKGYVDREKEGNRLETQLSTMGRMWVETHRG